MCILKLSCVAASHRYHSCSCHVSPRIGVYFAVSPCIVVYRIVSVCICSIDLNRRGRRQLALRKKSGKSTRIRVRTKKPGIDTYRRVSGTVSIDCFDQYRACIEWASGTVTYRYVSGMYRKGQIGCVENGHVFTVFTRIERAKSCVRRKRLYCHVSCMSRTGPNWGAGICMYREVSIETI